MDYKVQLISLLISFIFGIAFYFTSLLNYKIIKKYNAIFKYIITFLYMLNISIIYISLLFKINNGNVHPYFILLVLCGFLFGLKIKKALIKNVKFYESIVRKKKRWYNLAIIRVIIWIERYLKKIKED